MLSVSQQFANASAEGTLRRTTQLSAVAAKPEVVTVLRRRTPATIVAARAALAAMPADNGRRIGRLIQWRRVVLTPQLRQSFRRFIGSGAEPYFGNRSGSLWYGLDGTITAGPPDSVQPGRVVAWTRPGAGEQLAIVRPLRPRPG